MFGNSSGADSEPELLIDEPGLEAAHNGLLAAVDSGLGEQFFAENIRGTEIRLPSKRTGLKGTHEVCLLGELLDYVVGQGQLIGPAGSGAAGARPE
ncbi:MAG: hypothetical protein HN849_08805 [Victivallales bacterium]|nr:hypothetical protein [Victivallales bacterium]